MRSARIYFRIFSVFLFFLSHHHLGEQHRRRWCAAFFLPTLKPLSKRVREIEKEREREREKGIATNSFVRKKNVPVKSIDRSNSRCPVFAIRRRWRRPSRPFIIIFFYFLGFRRIVVRCVFVGSCGDRIASPIVRGIAAEFFCATPRARTSSDFLL